MTTERLQRPFSAAEAVPLLSALISDVCSQLGARAMLIKGAAAEVAGLRNHRVSADVDVLIEPGQFDTVVDRLRELGWHERDEIPTPRVVPVHSVTLIHNSWPADIDAHWQWPGFLVAPETAFELLWQDRQAITIAHQQGVTLSQLDHQLLFVLHALRTPHAPTAQREFTRLSTLLTHTFDTTQLRAEALARAAALGASETLQPLWEALHLSAPPHDPLHQAALADWLLLAQGDTAAGWVASFEGAHGAERLRILDRFLWPSATHLRTEFPRLTRVPLGVGLALAWSARLLRTAIRLPQILLLVGRIRKTHSSD